jgi:hypothetical protein
MIEKPLSEWSEKELDVALFGREKGLAPALGWTLNYHTYRSTRSQSGFPDRVLVRERIIFVELKSETNRPTAEQKRWLTGLANAGAEVYLWRPTDLDEAASVLNFRSLHGYLASPTLWLPEGARADSYRDRRVADTPSR